MSNFFSGLLAKTKKLNSCLWHFFTKTKLVVNHAEDGFLAFLFCWRYVFFAIIVSGFAFLGRIFLWPFASADYNECLHIWVDEVRGGNGFHSIGRQIGNYTAPYHYLMALMTYFPGLSNLDVIKITSTVADFFMAAAAAVLCFQLTQKTWKAFACYAAILCLPTVFLNSAAWGQCDAMYTFFVLLFLVFLLQQKNGLAMLFYGIALAIKLQAVFVLPAIAIFWLCGKIRLKHILMGLLGYFLMFVPAIIGQGNFTPLFRAYAMQTKINSISSNIYNGASLFLGIDAEMLLLLSPMLIFGTFIAIGALALYCMQHKNSFNQKAQFLLVALMAVLVPFLLPAMKDRYYYMIEVLLVVYALLFPQRFFAPLLLQLASLPSYMAYLVNAPQPFGRWPVLLAGATVLLILWDLHKVFSTPNLHSLHKKMFIQE